LLLFDLLLRTGDDPYRTSKEERKTNQKRKMKENQTKTKTKRYTVFSYNTNELKNFF